MMYPTCEQVTKERDLAHGGYLPESQLTRNKSPWLKLARARFRSLKLNVR